MKETEIVKSQAIIVGIAERGSDVPECERSLDELERLLDTAGGEVFARVIQVKESFDLESRNKTVEMINISPARTTDTEKPVSAI